MVLEVALVVDNTLATAPTFRFSWVLIPPATFRAPVVSEDEVVVSVILTLSASTSSRLACCPYICPATPIPPAIIRAPVVVVVELVVELTYAFPTTCKSEVGFLVLIPTLSASTYTSKVSVSTVKVEET